MEWGWALREEGERGLALGCVCRAGPGMLPAPGHRLLQQQTLHILE
jgi:hypothetical protein